MKNLLLIILIVFLSCTADCEIDTAKITELSAQITAIQSQKEAATTTTAKAIYQRQIEALEQQITTIANYCN